MKDAENQLICLDAETQLYDVGYLSSFSPSTRARSTVPPNYARFTNSIRPDQQTVDITFNTIFLPDPVEGFSWLLSTTHITMGEEILVDYGDSFWDHPHYTVPVSAPNPVTVLVGKAFSSDNVGDGPWRQRSVAWTQYLDSTSDISYSLKDTQVLLWTHDGGLRLLRSELDRIFAGTTPVADLAPTPMVKIDYGQQYYWLPVLFQLYSEVDHTISISAFVTRILLPALEAIQQHPADHALIHTLRSTSISDLGVLDLNELTLPLLLSELSHYLGAH